MSKANDQLKDRKDWKANINEVPGLEADLKKLMLETGSHTHAELLSRMSFAHRNIKTVDSLWRLMFKPDKECTKREMVAKRIIMGLYHFSGTSTREVSELILDEIDKVTDNQLKEDNKSKKGSNPKRL